MSDKPLNVFNFVSDISYDKQDIMTEENQRIYAPWTVNKSLSYHLDSVLYANDMNQYGNIPIRAQYLFYLNSLRPKRRFAKWVKQTESEELSAIEHVFGYNTKHAQDAYHTLTPDQRKIILAQASKGESK